MRVHSLLVRERLQRAGWPTLLGAGLVACSLLYAGFDLWPAWRASEQLRAQRQQAERLLADVERGVAVAPRVPGRQLDDFHQRLPAQLQATQALDRIYALAEREHISLARGEYALGVDPQTRLARYQIVLPVSGSYAQVRRFLHSMGRELPALVLEDLELQRKRIADAQLGGRIRMTLYLSRS